jgi:NitT/TauT family transport system ATP-binding protein
MRSSGATIALQRLGMSFGRRDRRLEVLVDIDLEIQSGEVLSILGPSGCGKTTLLRLIAGLAEPTSGSILVNGAPPDRARRSKQIALVPQSPALLPWRTVEQNARLLLDINRRATPETATDPTELLAEVGLGDFGDALPHELSGGMQQRVALVRALALGAPIVVLDEPFAALDELTRVEMRHLLARLCEQTSATVVFVTHSIAEAVFIADRVVIMSARPGRIIGIEPVPFDRPRRAALEDDPAFFALETRVRHLITSDKEAGDDTPA